MADTTVRNVYGPAILDNESVKIQEESQEQEASFVLLNSKKNCTEKFVIPIVVALATAIIIFAFSNMTTKSMAEISRVEQKVDGMQVQMDIRFDDLDDKFDILFDEIRILRSEQGE